MKLKEVLQDLQRKYKKITAYKYVYNKMEDLTKKSSCIIVYYLIYNDEYGYDIMHFRYKRSFSHPYNVKQWRKYLLEKSDEVFVGKVLPAINNKTGVNWIFKDLILWSVENALGKTGNTDTSTTGNKTK